MSQSPTCIPKFALYISRPFLHVDHSVNSVNINFTLNLTQGVFSDRIYRINNHTETWNFNASTLVTSVSHKITAKCDILCLKTLLLTEKELHAIHFFVATCNVCPLAIPKSCAQNMSIRLLENHSLSSKLCFYEKQFVINEGKSSQKTSSTSSQTWDRHIFWNQKTCGVWFTSRACSSCSYVHLKLQTWRQGTGHMTSWRLGFTGNAKKLDVNVSFIITSCT